MAQKKKPLSEAEEEIKKLYDPNFFYEYGDNPALKRLMEMLVENNREGKYVDTRTSVKHDGTK